MTRLTHLNPEGQAHMVDVGDKPIQRRIATATGRLRCSPATIEQLRKQALPKGDALAVARVAGIQAAKRTADWIPLCHTLPLEQVTVDFDVEDDGITISAIACTCAKTGVEMEALVAVAAAGLALFDMLKAIDSSMELGSIKVIEKTKQ